MDNEQPSNNADQLGPSQEGSHDLSDEDVFWGKFVLAGCFFINFIADGCAYSFGVLLTDLLEYFGETKSKTSWIGSLFMAVPLLCGPVASMISAHVGIRLATMGGGFIFFIGFLTSNFVQSVEMLYLTYGIVAGFGMSLPYLNSIVIISQYFRKRTAFATGVAECAAGLGTIVFAPLTEALLNMYGWRGTMYILAGLAANVIVCGALFRPLRRVVVVNVEENLSLITPTEDTKCSSKVENGCYRKSYTPSRNDEHETQVSKTDTNDLVNDVAVELLNDAPVEIQETKKSKYTRERKCRKRCMVCIETLHLHIFKNPFYILFIVSSFILYVWFDTPFVYLANRAIGCGLSPAQGALLVSVIGVTHTVGNLVFGLAGDMKQMSLPVLYGVSIAASGASLLAVPSTVTFATMAITAASFGLLSAASEALSSMLLIDILGACNLSQSYGFTMFLKGVANLGGPPVAGLLHDISGSYDSTFYSAGAWIVVAGLIYIPTACLRKYTNRKSCSDHLMSKDVHGSPIQI